MQFDNKLDAESGQNVDTLLRAVFPTEFEANLVQILRNERALTAEHGLWHQGALIGYVGYSPIEIEGSISSRTLLGVGPMAIDATLQNQGHGKKLLIESLETVAADGLVLLGHVGFYRHFGFEAAANHGLRFGEDGSREEAFMARELTAGAFNGLAGRVLYHKAFYGG